MVNCACVNKGLAIEQSCPCCGEMKVWTVDESAKPLAAAMGRELQIVQQSQSEQGVELEVEEAIRQSENSRLRPVTPSSQPQRTPPTLEDNLRREFGLPNDPALRLEEGDLP